MEQTTEKELPLQEGPTRNELVRPVEGRIIAGVGRAFADRFGLPPWLPRAIFVASVLAGGLGLALYGAGWALIRSEDEAETPAERFFSNASSGGSWLGIALIALAALILLGGIGFFSGEVLLAVGLLSVGVLMYTGHIPGSTASKPGTGGGSDDSTERTAMESSETSVLERKDIEGDGGAMEPPMSPTPTPPAIPPSKPRERSILGRLTIGATLIALGLLAILDNIEALAIDAGPRHYVALAVTVIGVGLLVGSILGRARWLILVAVFLVPTMLFSPALEYDWNSEAFQATHTPVSFEELQSGYTGEIGELTVDLTGLPWDGRTVDLFVDLDVGQVTVLLPDDVAIEGQASVNVGHVAFNGRESAGLGSPNLELDEPGTRGTIRLDAHVDVGDIDIQR